MAYALAGTEEGRLLDQIPAPPIEGGSSAHQGDLFSQEDRPPGEVRSPPEEMMSSSDIAEEMGMKRAVEAATVVARGSEEPAMHTGTFTSNGTSIYSVERAHTRDVVVTQEVAVSPEMHIAEEVAATQAADHRTRRPSYSSDGARLVMDGNIEWVEARPQLSTDGASKEQDLTDSTYCGIRPKKEIVTTSANAIMRTEISNHGKEQWIDELWDSIAHLSVPNTCHSSQVKSNLGIS